MKADYTPPAGAVLENGVEIKIENDDWGHFIRVVNEAGKTLYLSHLVIEEVDLPDIIEKLKQRFA